MKRFAIALMALVLIAGSVGCSSDDMPTSVGSSGGGGGSVINTDIFDAVQGSYNATKTLLEKAGDERVELMLETQKNTALIKKNSQALGRIEMKLDVGACAPAAPCVPVPTPAPCVPVVPGAVVAPGAPYVPVTPGAVPVTPEHRKGEFMDNVNDGLDILKKLKDLSLNSSEEVEIGAASTKLASAGREKCCSWENEVRQYILSKHLIPAGRAPGHMRSPTGPDPVDIFPLPDSSGYVKIWLLPHKQAYYYLYKERLAVWPEA